ncbi:regulatory protein RecX [Myroides odoratus]|uniref:regulatory protein RecX n=1 Tax=Myroides odoratus TaxID=256 RepID=UPI0039B01B60
MNTQSNYLSFDEAKRKLENYCAYQDRCHSEVINKMYLLGITPQIHDDLLVHLIEHRFLNEERFAKSFVRGKHRLSAWGKNRITAELKFRDINSRLIAIALTEIEDKEYFETFDRISANRWSQLTDQDLLKKKQKFQAYLFRKGYSISDIISKTQELEKE